MSAKDSNFQHALPEFDSTDFEKYSIGFLIRALQIVIHAKPYEIGCSKQCSKQCCSSWTTLRPQKKIFALKKQLRNSGVFGASFTGLPLSLSHDGHLSSPARRDTSKTIWTLMKFMKLTCMYIYIYLFILDHL